MGVDVMYVLLCKWIVGFCGVGVLVVCFELMEWLCVRLFVLDWMLLLIVV